MKSKAQLIGVTLAVALISLMPAPRTLAQHAHDQKTKIVWKTGMVRLSKSAWAGNVRLKSGMYHVKHLIDGVKHVLVFRSVALRAGKDFPMWEEKEVARLECRVEPVTKSTSNTKISLGRNAAGELVIEEIQIAGEKVKHILSGSGSGVKEDV